MSNLDPDSNTDVATKKKTKVKHPEMFKVILLNDDYTTMEFVVHVLQSVFLKSLPEATKIMLNVHRQGQGQCGIYTKQIAETKVLQVHEMAKAEGFPLRCTMELI